MNDEKKYPFNTVAVLWFQAWRNAVREAKSTPHKEIQEIHCRKAALCQANYIAALITGEN